MAVLKFLGVAILSGVVFQILWLLLAPVVLGVVRRLTRMLGRRTHSSRVRVVLHRMMGLVLTTLAIILGWKIVLGSVPLIAVAVLIFTALAIHFIDLAIGVANPGMRMTLGEFFLPIVFRWFIVMKCIARLRDWADAPLHERKRDGKA